MFYIKPNNAFMLIAAALFICRAAFADDETNWIVPRLAESPITWDSGQLVEGTSTAPALSAHGHIFMETALGMGIENRVSQLRGALSLGLGLPLRFETAISLPFGSTFAVPSNTESGTGGPALAGLKEQGPAIGDLQGALLFSAFDSTDGGLGLLFGIKASAPTGDHERLFGEGWFSAEPFMSLAFQILGSRFALNLGYRIRPEHIRNINGHVFEQDDDLIWRAGIRIPKKFDIAWSVEAEGTIGLATSQGVWPSSQSRPVLLAAGLDFPVTRLYRFSTFAGFGIVGETAPAFSLAFRLSRQPRPPDEDVDGVFGKQDKCPLLKEDKDSFEDDDGCPDLDNDKDGFPDDEDKCPLKSASEFSQDGC